MVFADLVSLKNVFLYAGTIYDRGESYKEYIGLSLDRDDDRHIKHNLLEKFPIDDNSVNAFLSEDVFEHIRYEDLVSVIDEIYRILKPEGYLRIGIPDYNCDILRKRCFYDFEGNIAYDPGGGGTFENPGHLWFPTYNNVKKLLNTTMFYTYGNIEYFHYWIDKENFVCKPINYEKGYIQRTPDHDPRVQNPYRPMSIVVDLYKGQH